MYLCNKQVRKVESVTFYNGMKFNSNPDHSKWAVAVGQPWTCIGDINRKVNVIKIRGVIYI